MTRSLFTLLLFPICIFSFQTAYGQVQDLPPNPQAGKCYAKCLIEPKTSEIVYKEITYPHYIGTDPKIKTETKVLTLQIAETKVTTKTRPDCIPSDDDDCTYEEYENVPGKYKTVVIPKKRRKVPKTEIVYETLNVAMEESARGQWQEVNSFAIYTGSDPSVQTITKTIESGGTSRWEKKKADQNCLSKDPNDCLVWCLVETPLIIETYEIPVNVNDIPESDISYITTRTTQKGGYTEWREVLCAHQVTKTRISAIRRALEKRGYQFPNPTDQMDSNLKSALFDFQRNNGLPIGALDLETLESLNVYY